MSFGDPLGSCAIPWVVFGPPQQYAGAIVESIGTAPGPRPGPVRLHARGITKRYGRRTVLRDALPVG
ncbi:hypothetical protein [Micromonospora sp. NPDC049301]|uniref:hypothetical protein n=1 Tax=Micromonospora sp. NPDC049301 TaxID=3155723 RepID=UPI003426DD29